MKEQKPAALPWRMLLPLIAVVILGLAWSVYWFIASSMVQKVMAERRAELAEGGHRLACAAETWSGFPFRFEFDCDAPVVTDAAARTAHASRLRAVTMAYNPWHVLLLLDGPTTLSRSGAQSLTVKHQGILASLKFRDFASDPDVSIEIPKLDVVGWFQADEVLIHTRPEPENALGVALSARKTNYQPEGRPPLSVEAGSLFGTIRRDGILAVSKIELQEGSTIYQGQGEVGLDADRRIAGTLATETNDFDGLMRILEPHLHMTPQQLAGFKTMMGLLGQNAQASIIAKDGQLYIGPFKVAELFPVY